MLNTKDEIVQFKKLMRGISKNDKLAVETFYNEYIKIIKATAMHICKKSEIADEVINDVLFRVWKFSKKFKEITNPKGWIYRVTVNAAKTRIANIKEHDCLDESAIAFAQNTIDPPAEDDFMYLIKDLSDFEQQIIILKFLCDFTFESIAAELDKPTSSISSTYYRSLEKLKNNLKIFD